MAQLCKTTGISLVSALGKGMKAPVKPKGLRPCPELQRDLTPQECGAGRGTTIACTAECSFNPMALGHETEFARIETRLLEKMQERLFDDIGYEASHALKTELEEIEDELAAHTRVTQELLYKYDTKGRNVLETWQAEGAKDLNNDERNFFRCYLTLRPALLEVQEIVDEQTVRVIDLLESEPKPRLLMDSTCAQENGRFTTLFTWVYDTPHFLRLRGGACLMDDCGDDTQAANLRVIIQHLGGPAHRTDITPWLGEHFMKVCDSIGAVQTTRWEQLMQMGEAELGMDDQVPFEYDTELVPPSLLERPFQANAVAETEAEASDEDELLEEEEYSVELEIAETNKFYQEFVDRPLELLANQTPRAAAADIALRPVLIELMKKHVRGIDKMRREQGLDIDLNGLLKELGLHEILFPAPPLGIEEEDAMMEDE